VGVGVGGDAVSPDAVSPDTDPHREPVGESPAAGRRLSARGQTARRAVQ